MWGLNDVFRKAVYGDEGQANDGVSWLARLSRLGACKNERTNGACVKYETPFSRQYISYFYYNSLFLANILTQMANFYIHKNPRDLLKELSVNARTLRKERKWSQEEMARRANMSLGSYKRFEQSGQISLESLLKIAFVFDRLNEFEGIFLSGDEKPSEKLFN